MTLVPQVIVSPTFGRIDMTIQTQAIVVHSTGLHAPFGSDLEVIKVRTRKELMTTR